MPRIYVFPIVWTLLLVGFVWVLSQRITLQSNEIPALGPFLSPFQGFWWNAEPTDSYESFSIKHHSLSSEVEIILDDRMVPHIYGENIQDISFALGYMQAYHRLWQMDISVRDVTGTLSEVIGERALDRDIKTRREGFTWAIDKALALYSQDEETMLALQAYTDGVNHRIEQLRPRDYPLEFKLLGYKPEKWTIRHSVAASKSMARVLTMRNADIQYSGLIEALGSDLFNLIFPTHMNPTDPVHPGPWDDHNPMIQPGTMSIQTIDRLSSNHIHTTEEEPHMASNNWAIAGSKSKSGSPILCNDPHLSLTLPSVWYEAHLVTPQFNVYGVSLLGLGSVIIGFNEHIAWGITNGGTDVLDYLKVTWQDTSKSAYLFEGEWNPADFRTETIHIKGKNVPHIIKVPYTIWGPIAIEQDSSIENDLAMRWSAHDVLRKDELMVFMNLAKAKTLQDYEAAMRKFPSPIQNVVFASKDDDIAIRSQGFWPNRMNYSGRFISDAADSKSSFHNYIPYDHIPATINPSRGFVSSANQESTDLTYPYIYFGSYENYRGRMLNRLLEREGLLTTEDMMRMQLSNHSLHAEEALPIMLKLLDTTILTDTTRVMLEILNKWDYNYEKESTASGFFDEWFGSIMKLTFDETTSKVSDHFSQKPDYWVVIDLLKKNPDHVIFNQLETSVVETGSDIVTLSFLDAWKRYKIKCPDPLECEWLKIHRPIVNHLASIEAFARYPETPGTPKALNAVSKTQGPSWRQIVELRPDGPVAFGIIPGGQSGNPGSRFYDDSVDKWARGEYHSLHLYKSPSDIPNILTSIQLKPK